MASINQHETWLRSMHACPPGSIASTQGHNYERFWPPIYVHPILKGTQMVSDDKILFAKN